MVGEVALFRSPTHMAVLASTLTERFSFRFSYELRKANALAPAVVNTLSRFYREFTLFALQSPRESR